MAESMSKSASKHTWLAKNRNKQLNNKNNYHHHSLIVKRRHNCHVRSSAAVWIARNNHCLLFAIFSVNFRIFEILDPLCAENCIVCPGNMSPVEELDTKKNLHWFSLQVGYSVAVHGLDHLEFVVILPRRSVGNLVCTVLGMVAGRALCTHHTNLDHIENVVSLFVLEIGQLTVKIETVQRRRYANQCCAVSDSFARLPESFTSSKGIITS